MGGFVFGGEGRVGLGRVSQVIGGSLNIILIVMGKYLVILKLGMI